MSGLLDQRRALVFGVANEWSIATSIARALSEHGAALGIAHLPGERMARRVAQATEDLGPVFYAACDLQSDPDIAKVFAEAENSFGTLDVLVHSVAFAPPQALKQPLLETTRADFLTTLDVSSYSLLAVARQAAPLMRPGGAILTMSYLAAHAVVPDYGVMAIAKAALENTVRYLAAELGPRGIRVNAVSAGPVKTLAMRGLPGGERLLADNRARAPLRRNIATEEIANAALYLCSPLASAVTGEIHYVDGGYHTVV